VFPNSILSLGLNVGCGSGGTCYREPYINLDIDKQKNLESWKKKGRHQPITFIISDAQCLPFSDNIFDEVYASHLLEHFNWNFVQPVLKEWYRVCKKGGRIKICVPDFEWAVNCYLGKVTWGEWEKSKGLFCKKDGFIHGMKGGLYRVIYGWMGVDVNDVGHKCVFDYEMLAWLLKQTGFKNVRRGEIHCCPYPVIREEVVVVAEK